MSPEESEPFDLESEWPEAKFLRTVPRGVGDDESLWLYPVLLLYVGFFFGPFVTVLASVLALKGRISLRHAAILTGVAGTAFCLLQGLSAWYGPTWSEYGLQAMRSAFNFATGIVAYVTVRQTVVKRLRATRATLVISVVAFAIAAAIFFLTPPQLLVALGR